MCIIININDNENIINSNIICNSNINNVKESNILILLIIIVMKVMKYV